MSDQKTKLRPVPVVRLIVPNAEGRVLVLKRCNTGYGGGRWCLPGGKIDYGQTVEETIMTLDEGDSATFMLR